MRRFFYASLGVLALALAFHLGSRTATAQSPIDFVGITATTYQQTCALVAITAAGDLWVRYDNDDPCMQDPFGPWVLWGRIPGGSTALQPATWGQIKAGARE